MGIGQVVTVRLPAEQLRAVNRAIEESAWGAYRTEFYATYDYKSIWEASRAAKEVTASAAGGDDTTTRRRPPPSSGSACPASGAFAGRPRR